MTNDPVPLARAVLAACAIAYVIAGAIVAWSPRDGAGLVERAGPLVDLAPYSGAVEASTTGLVVVPLLFAVYAFVIPGVLGRVLGPAPDGGAHR